MDELLLHAQAELPGILNWALDGLEDWKSNGLRIPKSVQCATEEYRSESDTIQLFIQECC